MEKNLFHHPDKKDTEAKPHLVVVFPQETTQFEMAEERFEIEGEDITLGSASSSNIQLSHPVVKPLHARIYHDRGVWWFTDTTDTFQVLVNGLIVRLFPIREDGFSFSIGPLLCRFFLGTSSQSQYEQHLYEMSRIDPLTHVFNRAVFSRRFRQDMERCVNQGRPISLLMIDLDHFRDFNNTYGHSAGDAVLRQIAWRVLQQLRKTELLARLGGDEFAILLPNTDAAQAQDIAARVCAAIATEPVMYEDHALSVTASIGCATTREWMDLETLTKEADASLYKGKNAGRNQVWSDDL